MTRNIENESLFEPGVFIPPAVFCIGLNYREHAQETGASLPEFPVIFMKNPAAVTGHEQAVRLPASCVDPLQAD
ncbi:MAG: fumarylacetoacetate hydrolase family protein, partial [Desulfobacteraceae bacterium]